MGYELRTKARLLGGDIHAKAKLGPIYKEVVAPEDFLGPYEYTPTGAFTIPIRDQLATEDIQIAAPPTEEITITENGVYVPAEGKVGFSRVTVTEEWDGILYPITDETDPLYESKVFNGKWVHVYEGDTVIVEGYGRGRWIGFRGLKTITTQTMPGTVNIAVRSGTQFDYLRLKFDVMEECYAIIGGYSSTPDGGHSANAGYCFCGGYLKYKVIHAS